MNTVASERQLATRSEVHDPNIFQNGFMIYVGGDCGAWTINPYMMCDFRCTYCITMVQGRSKPILSEAETIRTLRTCLGQAPASARIVVGGWVDAYPHAERKYRRSRQIVKELGRQQRRFNILTKGDHVCDDIDLLSANPLVSVTFSLSTLDEKYARLLEPNAPPPDRRIRALNKLREAGVNVKVNIAPWIPKITDTSKLLQALPPDVEIEFERLKILRNSRRMKVLDMNFTQDEVDEQFQRERERFEGPHRFKWSYRHNPAEDGWTRGQ